MRLSLAEQYDWSLSFSVRERMHAHLEENKRIQFLAEFTPTVITSFKDGRIDHRQIGVG
jgi:hypothetical protein